jgi:glycosyltransferase involved in cell wall biosynthesis
MKSKCLWLINHDATVPEFETRLRTNEFADYFGRYSEVYVLASSVIHNSELRLLKRWEFIKILDQGSYKTILLKTPSYGSNKFLRIVGYVYLPLAIIIFRNRLRRPDVISITANVPFDFLFIVFKKLFQSKIVVEILDLWPESFVTMGLLNRDSRLLKVMIRLEKYFYKHADKLVFSMPGAKDYLIDINYKQPEYQKISIINNGVNLDKFYSDSRSVVLKDADLENDAIDKVIYMGSMRHANDLDFLIDTACYLRDKTNVKFLLYGDGDQRPRLEERCLKEDISNVIWKQKYIPMENVPYVLSRASVNIMNYRQGEWGKYGGSQSKLFQYLAAGNPIACNIEVVHSPIIQLKLGISYMAVNPKNYSQEIFGLVNMSEEERLRLKKRAQSKVREFDYVYLAERMKNEVFDF